MSHSPTAGHAVPPIKMGLAISNAKLCMWLFLGTEIMFFTAFIGTYIVLRMGSKGWPTDPDVTHIRVAAGGINTFVLILSSYFVVVAHEAMSNRDFGKARKFLQWTFALAFVFLGIKSYEYYGKIDHDILPGHIAESDQQAKAKVLKESERAVTKQLTLLSNKAVAAKLTAKPEPADDVNKMKAGIQEAVGNLKNEDPALAEYKDFLALNADFSRLKTAILKETIPLSVDEPKAFLDEDQKECPAHESSVATWLTHLKSNWASVFGAVHEPHPILYGNIFASCYFLMTGFHALHVIIGMLLFWIVLKQPSLQGWHDFVENSGLYWHFVDLVWIFLFPLLYIV